MKVSKLFRLLSYGELRNQPGGGNGSGLVDEDRIPELVTYLNEGLLRLYSRFALHEKVLTIRQVQGRTDYPLLRRFAQHGHAGTKGAPCYFIRDTRCDPYLGDLIRVRAVYDATGERLPLNDEGKALSVFTPKLALLQVPNPQEGRLLSVTYQARHRPLCEEHEDGIQPILDQEIDVPAVLEKALQKMVAAEYFASMASEGSEAKSDKLLLGAEGICAEVEAKDLVAESWSTTHDKLRDKGFV
jgi:hypothetical protein